VIRLADIPQRLLAQRPPSAAPLGWGCFQLGMLLLASSAFLGGLLLLVALILGSLRRAPPLADRCHQVLLVVAGLMVAGCLRASSGWLAWVGLANWLPFFWAFWGFQPYLSTPAARRRVALALVAGTVPVIVTGLGQLWLGWSGPFQMFGGLIIWHLKAGGNPPDRLAGLFDYANIAGAWLVLVWPLALAPCSSPVWAGFNACRAADHGRPWWEPWCSPTRAMPGGPCCWPCPWWREAAPGSGCCPCWPWPWGRSGWPPWREFPPCCRIRPADSCRK
jgi:hypothetical protein